MPKMYSIKTKDIKIDEIKATQIIDSRGTPTLQAELKLSDGKTIFSSVPSGASKGKTEAFELRDNNPDCLFSMGVKKAIRNIEEVIAPELKGSDPTKQVEADKLLEELDGTKNFSKLGANAALAVSSAMLSAGAYARGVEIFEYIGGIFADTLPYPMINILNGGKHADNLLDIQEFMIVPVGQETFSSAIFMALEVFHKLKCILKNKGYSVSFGDEGGFCPEISNPKTALDLITEAIEKAGFSGKVEIALDVAAGELYKNSKYHIEGMSLELSTEKMIDYLEEIVNEYKIISIEDPLAQDDKEGWAEITRRLQGKVLIVGDDLFTTNTELLRKGVASGIANAILIKPNQIGTITKTIECVKFAKNSGYTTIISHRSGETESTLISDIAVGLNSGFIKTGSLARSERTAKYNRLIYIEKLLKERSMGRLGELI